MIYKAIKYILENDSDFATAIGTDSDSDVKVYPIHPRRKVELPFCVFNIIDQRGNPTKDTNSQIDDIRVRVVVYDTELDDVIDLAEKARSAMAAYKNGGTVAGVELVTVDFESMKDTFEEGYGNRGAIGIEIYFEIWSTQ